jgi:hypothetical protein
VRCPTCGWNIEKMEQLSSKRLAPNASEKAWNRPAKALRRRV